MARFRKFLIVFLLSVLVFGAFGISPNIFDIPKAYAAPTLNFDKESYCPVEIAFVTMNDVFFDPNLFDIFGVEVFLNNVPINVGLALVETDINSGFYKGDFQITESIDGISVSDGDILTAEIEILSLSASAVIQCGPSSPEQAIQDLIDEIDSMNLQKGTKTSLISNLDSAIEKLTDDNPNNDSATCGMLDSFVNKVEAQSGKKIEQDDAGSLITSAEQIISSLGC